MKAYKDFKEELKQIEQKVIKDTRLDRKYLAYKCIINVVENAKVVNFEDCDFIYTLSKYYFSDNKAFALEFVHNHADFMSNEWHIWHSFYDTNMKKLSKNGKYFILKDDA